MSLFQDDAPPTLAWMVSDFYGSQMVVIVALMRMLGRG